MKKSSTLFIFHLIFITNLCCQNPPLWMRYPAISPDGTTIAFSYQGDIYTVNATGGKATPITLHQAHDYEPVWSPDGKKIAFASDRFGNFDVFIMSAEGGKADRLTYHSASDHPSSFSPDNEQVLFFSSRLDAASNQQYPSGALPELYQVPATGGRVTQVLTTPALTAQWNKAGDVMVFHDRKGYEDSFRKHHTSSVARDIWKYELSTNKYTQLTDFNGEDRNPVFAPNQTDIYYLSEATGSYNIHKLNIKDVNQKSVISQFEKHPIRYLSISDKGQLCFGFNGEIYTMYEGQAPQKVQIDLNTDSRYNEEKIVSVKKATEMALSPNGKEIGFIFRGEVFVSSIKEGTTKRITNTPEQERSLSFSPDGKAILYASERDGSWNVYQTKITRSVEPYFFNATLLNEEVVIATEAEEFQPAYSPDGKEVAYLEERTALKVVNLGNKQSRLIMSRDKNYSYADGDQYYAWSPDSKWFLVEFLQKNQWITQIGLVSAKGGETIENLTQSGYNNNTPKWSKDGSRITWFSDRDGMKNDGGWGSQTDIYALYLTQAAYDKYKLNEEEYDLLEEEKNDEKISDEENKTKEKDENISPITIDLDGLADRKVRLTKHSSRLSDGILSKDGEKLFYLTKFEKGVDLWETTLRTGETKIKSKLGAKNAGSIQLDKKGENLFILADGSIHKIGVKDGKKKTLKKGGEMILNEPAERAYLFEHVWRQVEKKFYKTDIHEVEWAFYKSEYARFLPHINNNYDFAEMLSELLGELNASHTGARFRDKMENADQTAGLGLLYDNDHRGEGLKITEVMDKSPVKKSDSKIKAGTIIEKIDGQLIAANTNYFQYFNRKAKKNMLLELLNPDTGERWEELVKPISLRQESQIRYERWVKNCRKIVEKASNGEIGYVHVRGMNNRSYRTVYEEVLGKNHGKKALIVDTRFNGGGWLHDDLATFLNGKNYMTFMPRDQNLGNEPQFKWSKPSIVVMGEGNYSDAHLFPYTYRALGIGKLLGMPVPGTGTAVWWERLQNGMVFGIPQVGMVASDGAYLENNQLEPDIKVMNDPEKVSKGQDQQLEAAVKELLEQVKP